MFLLFSSFFIYKWKPYNITIFTLYLILEYPVSIGDIKKGKYKTLKTEQKSGFTIWIYWIYWWSHVASYFIWMRPAITSGFYYAVRIAKSCRPLSPTSDTFTKISLEKICTILFYCKYFLNVISCHLFNVLCSQFNLIITRWRCSKL